MTEVSRVESNSPTSPRKASGAALLTLGGLAAAFGVAACCALPLLMISLGVGTAWLGGIASLAVPNRTLLLVFATLALTAGAVLLWRQQRHATRCGPEGGLCTPSAVRLLTLVGLVVGVLLLIAGYRYV